MNDLISRADAIAAAQSQGPLFVEDIQALPSASQPEAEPVAWRSVLEQYRDDLCEGFCKEDQWSDAGHSHPDMQRDCGGCRAAAALLALPTPAPVVPAEGLDAERLVAAWLDETEAFASRRERLLDDVLAECDLAPWLHAACQVGIDAALRAQQPAAPVSADMGNPISMIYRNYRGEVAERTVIPRRIWRGSTDWHPEPGWLMSAFDPEKGADRDFALADCDFRRAAPVSGVTVRPLVWLADGLNGQALVASALGLDVFYRVDGKPGNWTLTSPGAREYVLTPGYETRAAAQAAASVDYERRILSALDGGGVMAQEAGWQPIETAPRDGSSIIACTNEYDEPLILRWFMVNGHETWRDWDADGYINVTHWMPLPEPPALSALEGK